jgi:hypothetical protein
VPPALRAGIGATDLAPERTFPELLEEEDLRGS